MTQGLFDDLVETAETVDTNEQPEQSTEQTNESAPESDGDKEKAGKRGAPKLPEVVREKITVQHADEMPDGYIGVKAFAFKLTQRNFEKAMSENRAPTEDDLVSEQAVYMATTNKRHTVPSAQLVMPSGAEVRGGIVLPEAAALAAWDARPERGEGAGRAGSLTASQIETRVLRAGKAKARLAKLEKQVQRYGELLEQVGKTWAEADEAYAEWVSQNEETIPDEGENEE